MMCISTLDCNITIAKIKENEHNNVRILDIQQFRKYASSRAHSRPGGVTVVRCGMDFQEASSIAVKFQGRDKLVLVTTQDLDDRKITWDLDDPIAAERPKFNERLNEDEHFRTGPPASKRAAPKHGWLKKVKEIFQNPKNRRDSNVVVLGVRTNYEDYSVPSGTSTSSITSDEKHSINPKLRVVRDKILWNHISPYHEKIIQANIELLFGQNVAPTLLSLIMGIDHTSSDGLQNAASEFLSNIINDRIPSLFHNTLPPIPSFYLPRRLVEKNIISENIFNAKIQDVLLFPGVQRHQLSQLAKGQCTDTSSSQIRKEGLSSRFILLEQENQFEKICDLTHYSVHVIDYRKGRIHWRKSKGSIVNIHKYIKQSENEFSENKIFNILCGNPIIISNVAGMGKSTFLAEIARTIRKANPLTPILFIGANEFVKKLKEHIPKKHSPDLALTDAIKTVVINILSKNQLGEAVLTSILSSTDPEIEILLDGFDEVSPRNIDLANHFLLVIRSITSFRLWITTRSHSAENLEIRLNCMGYRILPFNNQDQLQFLCKLWSADEPLDKDKLVVYANACLQVLKGSINNDNEDIAGVPLQCLLIGETFKEECKDYCTSECENQPHSPEISIDSIADLFQRFISKKFEIYFSHFGDDHVKEGDLFDAHLYLSYLHIFPGWAPKLSNSSFAKDKFLLDAILNVGIILSMEETPIFIHRTVAEYFVSVLFLVLHVSNFKHPICLIFLDEVLETVPKQTNLHYDDVLAHANFTICYFLNSLLRNSNAFIFSEIFISDGRNYFEKLKNIFRASMYHNFEHILESLIRTAFGLGDLSRTLFQDQEIAIECVKFCGVDLVKRVLMLYEVSSGEKYTLIANSQQLNLLSTAVKYGRYDTSEFLLQSDLIKQNLSKDSIDVHNKYVLHHCLDFSLHNSDKVIESQRGIIAYLLDLCPHLVESPDTDEFTTWSGSPLFCYLVHPKLLLELFMKAGHSLLSDHRNHSFLLKVVCYLNSQEFFELVSGIHKLYLDCRDTKLQQGILQLFRNSHNSSGSVLIRLLNNFEPHFETFKILKEFGINLNVKNEDGPILKHAMEANQGLNCITTLLDLGVDWEARDNHGRTVLHFAVDFGHSDAIEYFVKKKGMDVNIQDKLGQTPMQYAAKFGNGANMMLHESLRALAQHGATKPSLEQFERLLQGATISLNLDLVQLLLEWDVGKYSDKFQKMGLHWIFQHHSGYLWNDSFELAKLFLEHGADVNYEGETGFSPVELICLKEQDELNSQFLQLFAKNGAFRTPQTATKLLTLLCQNTKIIRNISEAKLWEILSDHGADFHQTDAMGNTVLHHVCLTNGQLIHIKWLLENTQLDPQSRNNAAETPLLYLVQRCNVEALEYILSHAKTRQSILEEVASIAIAERRVNTLEFLLTWMNQNRDLLAREELSKYSENLDAAHRKICAEIYEEERIMNEKWNKLKQEAAES